MIDTAYEIPGFVFTAKTHTYEEGTIPPEFKHVFVYQVGDGVAPATRPHPVVGVAQRNCKNGEVIPVMNTGISMVRLMDAVDEGDRVTTLDAGFGVAAAKDEIFHGIALASGAPEDRIPVLLCLNSAPLST